MKPSDPNRLGGMCPVCEKGVGEKRHKFDEYHGRELVFVSPWFHAECLRHYTDAQSLIAGADMWMGKA